MKIFKGFHTNLPARFFLGLLMALTATNCFSQQVSDQNWQVKTNLTGFLSNTISVEIERSLPHNFALTLQEGAIFNMQSPQPANVFEGYYFRLGCKMYLFQKEQDVANTGLSIKAEVHYSHWRDWNIETRGDIGERWENSIGGLLTLSYSKSFGEVLFLEPFLGIGYIPTWQNAIQPTDAGTFESNEVNLRNTASAERRISYFSRFWRGGNVVFAPGISLGLRF
jgi:hypothetical protein